VKQFSKFSIVSDTAIEVLNASFDLEVLTLALMQRTLQLGCKAELDEPFHRYVIHKLFGILNYPEF